MPSSRKNIHENLVHARSRLLAGELAEAREIARRMLGGANDVSVRAFLDSTDRRAVAEWSKARAAGEPEAMLAAAETLLAFGLFEDRWLRPLAQAAIKGEPTPEIVEALRQRSLETPLPHEETIELIQLVESAAGRKAALLYALDAIPMAAAPTDIVERAIELALALVEEASSPAAAAVQDGDEDEPGVSAEAIADAAHARLDALADVEGERLAAAIGAPTEGDTADEAETFAAERQRAAGEAKASDDLEGALRRLALEIAILRQTPQPTPTFESSLGAFAVMVPEPRGREFEGGEPTAVPTLPELPTPPRPRGNRGFVRQCMKLGSLWALNMKAETANEPLGWIWWVLEPILQIVMITFAVILLGLPLVNGMQIMPFAIIGVVTWLSTRQAIMVSLVQGGTLISQMDFPQVRAAHLQLARALRPLAIYLFVGICVIAVAFELDRSPFPDDPLHLLAAICSAWLIGLGVGSVLGSISLRWRSVRRLVGPLMRVTGLSSGLFFLPEQLPPNVSELLLWNPLMHAILIGRSAFFVQYDSPDANWTYLIIWLIGSLLVGMVCFMNDERKRGRMRR